MYFPEESDDEFELNIVPMIDVIFAILTFFIISSLFLTRAESLPVNLPEAASSETQEPARVTVIITASGEIILNQETVVLEELQSSVQVLIGAASESIILINADEAVAHGRVISVMDKLREIEGTTLGIATQQSESTL
jgi:biopolymer transport protein ExbD